MKHSANTNRATEEIKNMRNKLVTVLLVSITAGVASAQAAGSSGSDPNALWSNPATTHVATSSGSLTNPGLAGPGINEQGSFGLGSTLGEPLGPSRKPWLSDEMAVDGGVGRSFVDPDGIQVQGDVFFHNLDLLLRADTCGSPVHFGVDPEFRFVEHHGYQPGIPVPFGISYRRQQPQLAFFAELVPIFERAPATSLGWGGGVGIRFYFGR